LNDYKRNLKLAKIIERKNDEKSNLKAKDNPNMISCFILMKRPMRKVDPWMRKAKKVLRFISLPSIYTL
jgi:hypothetical protein